MAIFPSGIFSDFFRTVLVLEKLLLHTSLTNYSCSFGASITSKQLLSLSNCVFERAISLQ